MSTQKGNGSRTRSQKYKNRTVFKNDLYDKTPQQKLLNTMQISEVCQHCKGVLEWKIKYKKYKPLTQPKTCTRCQERKIRKAYHVLCRDCSRETRCCAKCLKSADEVDIEPPARTPEEEQKLKVEMEQKTKSLPERKRRAFLRDMEKGKKDESLHEEINGINDAHDNKEFDTARKPTRIPYTRDELLKKIEELKLGEEDIYDSDEDGEEENSESEESS